MFRFFGPRIAGVGEGEAACDAADDYGGALVCCTSLSFNLDNSKKFTREWFSWASSSFAEFVMPLAPVQCL